jgi:hypothetical protein
MFTMSLVLPRHQQPIGFSLTDQTSSMSTRGAHRFWSVTKLWFTDFLTISLCGIVPSYSFCILHCARVYRLRIYTTFIFQMFLFHKCPTYSIYSVTPSFRRLNGCVVYNRWYIELSSNSVSFPSLWIHNLIAGVHTYPLEKRRSGVQFCLSLIRGSGAISAGSSVR